MNKVDNIRQRAGFTLIEVLISMVVFSLLMVLVSAAMNFATRYWQKESGQLKAKVSEFIYLEKLTQSIAAIQPYGIRYEGNSDLSVFFEGNETMLTYVSEVGVNKLGPVAVAIRIHDTVNAGVQIQFAEQTLAEQMIITHADIANVEWQWITVKSNLVEASFAYQGFEDLTQLTTDRLIARAKLNVDAQNFSNFSGKDRNILPSTVKIRWKKIKHNKAYDFVMAFPIMINDQNRFKHVIQDLYVL